MTISLFLILGWSALPVRSTRHCGPMSGGGRGEEAARCWLASAACYSRVVGAMAAMLLLPAACLAPPLRSAHKVRGPACSCARLLVFMHGQGVLCTIIIIPIQSRIAKRAARLRRQTLSHSDLRQVRTRPLALCSSLARLPPFFIPPSPPSPCPSVASCVSGLCAQIGARACCCECGEGMRRTRART